MKKMMRPWYGGTLAGSLCGAAGLIFLSFIIVALLSYDPTDPTWFFVPAHPKTISNGAGRWGAQCAALLIFCFGSGAYAFVAGLSYELGNQFRSTPYPLSTKARLSVVFSLVLSISGLLTWYQGGGILSPGGLVGELIIGWLTGAVGTLVSGVIMHAVVGFGLFFLFDYLFFAAARWITASAQALWWLTRTYAPPVTKAFVRGCVQAVVWFVGRSYVLGVKATHALVDLFAGKDVQDSSVSIVEFEALVLREMHIQTAVKQGQAPDINVHNFVPAETVTHALEAMQLAPEQDGLARKAEGVKMPQESRSKTVKEPAFRIPGASLCKKEYAKSDEGDPQGASLAAALQEKLARFSITGSVVAVKTGPLLTTIEFAPESSAKLSRITALEDDLALALEAVSIRIVAPIPGRNVVGFEVARKKRQEVSFSEILASKAFTASEAKIPLILGKTTMGAPALLDLAATPHLLIAGSTGSGKSVALNVMLLSMLCSKTPEQLKLILIDPKRLEFFGFADIAHLLFPIVTDPARAIAVLKWAVGHMEERYEKMAHVGAKNLEEYNKLKSEDDEAFSLLVIMIDELADLMMTAGKEVEFLIARLAQMARASGIHLIVATQRPSVDVITGLIKVNFPSRIAFKVTSKIDSRTILDGAGAEKLLGKGDMLVMDSSSSLERIHGAYVSRHDSCAIVEYIKSQRPPCYKELVMDSAQGGTEVIAPEDRVLFSEVMTFIKTVDEVSISQLQRRFKIGFNRSARLIEQLEKQGLLMPQEGSKPRKIIH